MQGTLKKQSKYLPVGLFLRAARERAGLTQKDISKRLGYTTSQFISNFERGLCLPPIPKLKILISLYALSANELIDLVMACERKHLVEAFPAKGKR